MKNSIYKILVLILLIQGCDKGFEELNVDPISPNRVDPQLKLTSLQLYTASERWDNWRTGLITTSAIVQHLSTLATFWSGNYYTQNRSYESALWDRYYIGAVQISEDLLFQLNQESAPEEMKAITRIMRVFIYSRLTDLYGDIPYSEAGRVATEGIGKPKYDRQEDIYADMLKELEEATAALGSGVSMFGASDVIYNGDQEKWRKLGYSLMLRLGMRLTKVAPDLAEQWAVKAINGGVMTSNEDIFFMPQTNGPINLNTNGQGRAFAADPDIRLSDTFVDNLLGDPRLPILGARKSDGSVNPADLIGLPNGLDAGLLQGLTGEANSENYAEPNRSIITGLDAPLFFQTYAEVEFMLAEAAERWGLAGGDPELHYNEGVRAAMKMLERYGAEAVIADNEIDDFLINNPFQPSNALEQINTQYWLVTFLNGQEAFANWRRTGYPVLTPVNYPGNVTNGTIPRRMTYPESELTLNTENYQAAVSAQGPNELTTRIWWDVE